MSRASNSESWAEVAECGRRAKKWGGNNFSVRWNAFAISNSLSEKLNSEGNGLPFGKRQLGSRNSSKKGWARAWKRAITHRCNWSKGWQKLEYNAAMLSLCVCVTELAEFVDSFQILRALFCDSLSFSYFEWMYPFLGFINEETWYKINCWGWDFIAKNFIPRMRTDIGKLWMNVKPSNRRKPKEEKKQMNCWLSENEKRSKTKQWIK